MRVPELPLNNKCTHAHIVQISKMDNMYLLISDFVFPYQ